MLILISGPNSSGKSLYAEGWIARTQGPRYYLATMRPCTEDDHRRIEKHRAQRRGLGFTTIECPCQVGNAPVPADGVVLLEDVSNLLANAMFERKADPDSVWRDLCALKDRCAVLVAVTISGLQAEGYDERTAAYIRGLNELNGRLLEGASAAVSMAEGRPVFEKGEDHVFR